MRVDSLPTDNFSLLRKNDDLLTTVLMASDSLAFASIDDSEKLRESILESGEGRQWDMYGDVRWPHENLWIEIPLWGEGSKKGGFLILRRSLPADCKNPLEWAMECSPLLQFPAPIGNSEISDDFLQELASQGEIHLCSFLQAVCLFMEGDDGKPQFLATYTDFLAADGVVIPHFRYAALTEHSPVNDCRWLVHTLFCANEQRLKNVISFEFTVQQHEFSPALRDSESTAPKWEAYHPTRMVRTRPWLVDHGLRLKWHEELHCLNYDQFEQLTEIIGRSFNLLMLGIDRAARPRDNHLSQNESNVGMITIAMLGQGNSLYVLPEALAEEFSQTDCSEVLLSDIQWPYPDYYLSFPNKDNLFLKAGYSVDGCYVAKQQGEILICLTSRNLSIDYERSNPLTSQDPVFSLHLPIQDDSTRLTAAVEAGIADFYERNLPPEEDMSMSVEGPDGRVRQFIDGRKVSRARRVELFNSQKPVFMDCLNLVMNAICFISAYPGELEDSWAGEPPGELLEAANATEGTRKRRERRAAALDKLRTGDYTRIKLCGAKIARAMNERPGSSEREGTTRPHWRRGHWRRHRHGPSLALAKLLWIRPVLVNAVLGDPMSGHRYEIVADGGSNVSSE